MPFPTQVSLLCDVLYLVDDGLQYPSFLDNEGVRANRRICYDCSDAQMVPSVSEIKTSAEAQDLHFQDPALHNHSSGDWS